MNSVNQRLMDVMVKLKERERLQRMLEQLRVQQKQLWEKRDRLKEQLNKEELDVEKLEKISLINFIHIIKGDKEEVVAKEKQEALSAKLKYDETCSELRNIEREIDVLRADIERFGDLSQQYHQCIQDKEKLIQSSMRIESERLEEMIKQHAELKSKEKELKEALAAGREVEISLKAVNSSLQSAGNWGTWDMLGGGLIATMAKHTKIDEAREDISKVQSLLRKFHRELQDIGEGIDIDIEIGSFLGFADYFFDGFFVDWAVQSRIDDAQDKVNQTIYKVESLMGQIQNNMLRVKLKLENLEKERVSIIENF
ncbi:hypothetical protein [Petroclostridium sp. X23]|uniref:hypothetical protein n=1 Tax=Petroclostridium sp. X23 TaxID=3045146 RepID=UPI0024ADB31D|nr:hypothetical protein [Petroclostridium sp. X23]WHH58715.1 hypothetical protein QKW49_23465 [Petroclostridium sp. X23]